jgi:hypothetical protein
MDPCGSDGDGNELVSGDGAVILLVDDKDADHAPAGFGGGGPRSSGHQCMGAWIWQMMTTTRWSCFGAAHVVSARGGPMMCVGRHGRSGVGGPDPAMAIEKGRDGASGGGGGASTD